ncbi:hypothetical protein FO519_006319 [Halicephalobus sp. NKZ332]|nr:hypothetical protein FO519_006319 [Halicephalobus sp. NKZ332]
MNEIHLRVPLTPETFHCYRKWLREAIKSNTLFVAPDTFVQHRFAVLLATNFHKIYPKSASVILTTHETDVISYEDHCKAVGFPLSQIHKIKDEKSFRKSSATTGIYFISTKVMTNLLGKDVIGPLDIKLFVIPDCLKAVSNNGPGKLASQLTDSGAISNLGIQNLLVKNAGDPEMSEIVFFKGTKYTEVDFVDPLLDKLRLAVMIRTIKLQSAELINVCDPDSLIYSDVERWRTLALEADPEKADDVNIAAFLIEAYRLLMTYGTRAVYLVAGYRYTKFGKKSYALLTSGSERILPEMMEFDKKANVSKVTYDNYSFRREKSKLVPKRPVSEFPIEYRPEVEEEIVEEEPESRVDEQRIKLYQQLRKRPISLIDEVVEECERYLRGEKFPRISNGKTMDSLYFIAQEEKSSEFETSLFKFLSESVEDSMKRKSPSRSRNYSIKDFMGSDFEAPRKKQKISSIQEVSAET